jgi:glutamate:GABA antiporter
MESTRTAVRSHSRELKKELGLWNLVFTQILYVMGLSWVGTAAKLGPSHVMFWLLAAVLFYVPSAMVVVHLSRRFPLEGGLYQWAKIGFGERTGFLTAWNLWIYAMILMSSIGVQAAVNLAYAIGPRAVWMVENKWFIAAASVGILGGLAALSTVGLAAGKWLHGGGGLAMVVVLAAMVILPGINQLRGGHPQTTPFSFTLPALTLLNLNILGKLGFGALGGFEYVAIFAGECKDPAKLIGRSVIIAAPVIAALFILGTGSVLWFVGDRNIDLISPVSQVLSIATRPLGVGAEIASAVILLVLGMRIAQMSVHFAGTARLPMVAAWDRLLPAWFTRLHPRFRTPAHSIYFVGALTVALGIAGILGVASQEAWQLFENAAGIYYALPYLVMFALPLAGRAGPWVRIAATSGFLMTLLYIVLSIFPIIDVPSWWSFGAKIGGVVVAGNVVGMLVFEMGRRKESEFRSQKSE